MIYQTTFKWNIITTVFEKVTKYRHMKVIGYLIIQWWLSSKNKICDETFLVNLLFWPPLMLKGPHWLVLQGPMDFEVFVAYTLSLIDSKKQSISNYIY
jgi:hypothetical protein